MKRGSSSDHYDAEPSWADQFARVLSVDLDEIDEFVYGRKVIV